MSAKTTKPDPSEWMRMLTGNRLQTGVSRGAGSAFIFSTVRREIKSLSREGVRIGRKNEVPPCLADTDKTSLLRVPTLR